MPTAQKPKKKAAHVAAGKSGAPLGRYLRKFTLEGVRTFRAPVTLDFCHEDGSVAQWTVILGEDGTGKTTLLQYLAGMVPVEEAKTRRPRAEDAERRNAVPWYGPLLTGGMWESWHLGNASCQRTELTAIHAELRVSEAVSVLSTALPDLSRQLIELHVRWRMERERPVLNMIGSWKLYSHDFARQIRLFGYVASRHVAGSSSPYLTSDSSDYIGHEPATTLYNDDQPLISPEQWFLGLDHFSRSDDPGAPAAGKALASAQRCFKAVLPDIKGLTVKPHPGGRRHPTMTLMCTTPYGEVPFSRTASRWQIPPPAPRRRSRTIAANLPC